MYYWVIYDISKNTARGKVAKRCRQVGLRRVQKSVFLGRLKAKVRDGLRTEFNRWVNWRTDQVFFVPMSDEEYQKITRTGAKATLKTSLLPPPQQPAVY